MTEKKLTSDDYKRLAKEAEDQEKQAKNTEKSIDQEQSFLRERWLNCINASEVLADTDMHFYRDSQPKYFRKLQTKTWDKNNIEYLNTEVKFYPPSTLQENWIKLKSPGAKDMFRIMVEGGEITVKNPDTEEFITHTFESRVYDKITNTLKLVDDKTYNMLDLNDKLEPNYNIDETPECPVIIKALLYALSGNVIVWDDNLSRWTGNKEENLIWLEKWIYGTVHADIGNNMSSFPVFYGSGKVGRNALFDKLFRMLLGKDACFSGTWDIIHGNFDGYKLGKVFMFIDEVPEKGSWDILKNMTGSTDSFVKQKYGAEFVIDNTVRYAIGTNEEVYPLPVENGPQMMRVSPIKTSRQSTFAENTIKMLDQLNYQGYCRKLLKDSDDTLNIDTIDDFIVGDTLLRGNLNSAWASREQCQQLLNYLDYTYKSTSGNYSLQPLRAYDWDNIVRDRLPAITKVIDYLIEENIVTITTMELYEIYRVIQQERSDAIKRINGFGQSIKELLEEKGYIKHDKVYVSNDTRPTIYTKDILKTSFKDYSINIDKYIIEVQMGTNPLGPKQRKLRYKNSETDVNIDDKVNKLLKR